MSLRVALIEPYLGGSHQAWAEGYQRHSAHDVVLIAHDARFWKWRMQGSFVTLAEALSEQCPDGVDVVLASSMLHLPAFLGVARHVVGVAKVAVYFHESQFSYPLSPADRPDDTYPMINWASASTADAVFFNSDFHRRVFFEEADRFLRRYPDYQHTHLLDRVRAHSSVLPVGVDLARLDAAPRADGSVAEILWNQRWEYDKGPAAFAAAVTELDGRRRDFTLAMTGERFVGQPKVFDDLASLLGDRLTHFGFAEEAEYLSILRRADVVVSAAVQEFFGVALTEAVFAGAFPLVPDRLVYPERIPEDLHELCLYHDGELADRLEWALDHPEARADATRELRKTMEKFDWGLLAPRYDSAMEELVSGS